LKAAIAILALVSLLTGPHARGAEPGQPVPGCALASLRGGERLDPSGFAGQVIWVDFWASWCSSCAESFPFLEDLQRDLGARGLRVLAINVDEDARDALDFLARHPVSFPVAADPRGECSRRFRLAGMPASYLVDRQGIVRHAGRGFRAGEADALRRLAEDLLGPPIPDLEPHP
jgi:thiol-disulfide isomerase/thioredoxin